MLVNYIFPLAAPERIKKLSYKLPLFQQKPYDWDSKTERILGMLQRLSQLKICANVRATYCSAQTISDSSNSTSKAGQLIKYLQQILIFQGWIWPCHRWTGEWRCWANNKHKGYSLEGPKSNTSYFHNKILWMRSFAVDPREEQSAVMSLGTIMRQ